MSGASLTDDDARRFLADHPEIDGLDDVIAALLGARAERDDAIAERDEARETRRQWKEKADLYVGYSKDLEARATAAEAALATAKRDAWIAGRDAAAEINQRAIDQLQHSLDDPDDNPNELGCRAAMYCLRDANRVICALTPPAEAEGRRQDGVKPLPYCDDCGCRHERPGTCEVAKIHERLTERGDRHDR